MKKIFANKLYFSAFCQGWFPFLIAQAFTLMIIHCLDHDNFSVWLLQNFQIFFGWVLRRTNTVKVIWRPSSFTGGEVTLCVLFQAREDHQRSVS